MRWQMQYLQARQRGEGSLEIIINSHSNEKHSLITTMLIYFAYHLEKRERDREKKKSEKTVNHMPWEKKKAKKYIGEVRWVNALFSLYAHFVFVLLHRDQSCVENLIHFHTFLVSDIITCRNCSYWCKIGETNDAQLTGTRHVVQFIFF